MASVWHSSNATTRRFVLWSQHITCNPQFNFLCSPSFSLQRSPSTNKSRRKTIAKLAPQPYQLPQTQNSPFHTQTCPEKAPMAVASAVFFVTLVVNCCYRRDRLQLTLNPLRPCTDALILVSVVVSIRDILALFLPVPLWSALLCVLMLVFSCCANPSLGLLVCLTCCRPSGSLFSCSYWCCGAKLRPIKYNFLPQSNLISWLPDSHKTTTHPKEKNPKLSKQKNLLAPPPLALSFTWSVSCSCFSLLPPPASLGYPLTY
jgi:hypothetical protein